MANNNSNNSHANDSTLMPVCRRLFATPDSQQARADNSSEAVDGGSHGCTKHCQSRKQPAKKRTWKPMENCNVSKLEYSDHTAIRRKNFVDLVKEISLDFGANKGSHERTTKDMIDALQSASEAHLITNMYWAGEACQNAKRKKTTPRDYKLVRDINQREQHQYYHGTKL